jgi:EmrB/QacA subfamily drug resistance transporter
MSDPSSAVTPERTPEGTPSSGSLIVTLVAAAFFMENLDGTIIATALPQMARSFHIHPVDLSIGITSYLLTLAVFIPISGWVADRFGVRSVFTAALAIFTAASVLCGMTNGLAEFTAARVLQGLGGAMMVPVGRLAVLRATPKENLMRAISVITWPGLVAPIIGPPLGGFITTYSSWRWIFYLNLPLGLIGMVLAWRFISPARDAEKRPFDGLGFVLCGIAGTAIMYAMELIGRADASWAEAFVFLLLGLATGAAAWVHLKRAAHPVIDLSAFRIKTFAVASGGGSLFRISIGAVPFLVPLMFQLGFGMNAFRSGLLTLAIFAGNLSMKLITTPTMKRFGFRSVLIVNGACAALSLAAIGLLTPATPYVWILAVLFVSGLARSLQFTAINTLSFADVPKPQMSGASTLSSTLGQMTMGMGVAAGAIALRAAAWLHGHGAHSATNAATSAATAAATPTVSPADFSLAFVLVAALSAIAIVDVFGLDPRAGAHVSGHQPATTTRGLN